MRRLRHRRAATGPSKLDPFKGTIAEWLEKDPAGQRRRHRAAAPRPLGYHGGHSILREYVRKVRPHMTPQRAFVRMEPLAGERFEVDWGHFGALDYSGDMRKLYAFALVDAHSRMLYVEFTHSQSFGTFARCHVHAFTALGGIAREIAYDNLATAVAEHDGRLVRFLPRFLAFAREYGFFPHACNPASGWEKGKVERAIGYLRQNFWPLREFTDLHDVNRQVRQWLAKSPISGCIAKPASARWNASNRKLSVRCRSFLTITATRLKRWSTRISAWRSTAIVTVSPSAMSAAVSPSKPTPVRVTIYDRVEEVVSYARSWRRGQTFGADRFEKTPGRRPARGAPLAGAAATARFARWTVFARRCRSLSPRHGRHAIVRWAVRSRNCWN